MYVAICISYKLFSMIKCKLDIFGYLTGLGVDMSFGQDTPDEETKPSWQPKQEVADKYVLVPI